MTMDTTDARKVVARLERFIRAVISDERRDDGDYTAVENARKDLIEALANDA